MQQGKVALQIPADSYSPTANRSSVTHPHLQWNHPDIVIILVIIVILQIYDLGATKTSR